jgi:hypothetical protein
MGRCLADHSIVTHGHCCFVCGWVPVATQGDMARDIEKCAVDIQTQLNLGKIDTKETGCSGGLGKGRWLFKVYWGS